MKTGILYFVTLVASCVLAGPIPVSAGEPAQQALAAVAEGAEGAVIEGSDDWLFLKSGANSYSLPAIWPREGAGGSDPLEVVTGFAEMLANEGIELIVVPVPDKAAVYPDKLVAELAPDALADGPHEDFVSRLQEAGVTVVDLAPEFRAMRASGTAPFARQDSHWSPAGMEFAVKAVADELAGADWLDEEAEGKAVTGEAEVSALGDLVTMGELEGYEPEVFSITRVEAQEGSVEDDESPVVLIGDSHLLVYHQPINGGIEASGAGFPDHFFAETGVGVDLVANQGGGVNLPRARLARRRGDDANLAGKQAVVWVFSSRDLTEASRGWVPIPVIR